jgi:hypothetical protein
MSFLDTVTMSIYAVEDTATSSKLINEAFTVSAEVHYGMSSAYMELPSGSSASPNLDNFAAGEVLYMVSDRPVAVTVNGANTPFNATHLYLDGGNITALAVKNNQAVAAHIRFAFLGT